MAPELVWAKVRGWHWWPAVVLPAPDNARETRGARSVRKDGDDERIVLFLVDKTVARVPSSLPAFTQHYTRFLSATYANKKLFQAVEEARGLAYEDAAARDPHTGTSQQQLIAYPPPVRDDFRRSGKQLLHWLTAAALDPLGQYNKLSDQSNKRVLHAVHNNRLLCEDVKPFLLAPQQATADGSAAVGARANSHPATSAADAVVDQLPAKRQRKPQAWLQMYGDLPEALRIDSGAPVGHDPSATGRTATAGAGPGGSAALHKAQMARVNSASALKAGCQLGKLKQQQLVRQHSSAQRGLQRAKGVVDGDGVATQRGRKRTQSTAAAEDSDSDQESKDCSWLISSDSDVGEQQRQRHSRDLGLGMARRADAVIDPNQLRQQKSKKRCMMDLSSKSTPGARVASTAAVAAAAVAAAFRGAAHPVARTATGSGSIDQLGGKGSGSRSHGGQQQQQGAQRSDTDSDEYQAGYHYSESDSDELSDAYGQVDSGLKWRNRRSVSTPHRRSSTRALGRGPASTTGGDVAVDARCRSPQLLRPDGWPTGLGVASCSPRAGGVTGLGSGRWHCCCCCCRHQQQGHNLWQLQHSDSTVQWQQQQLRQCNAGCSSGQQQADWLAEDQDMLGAAAVAADIAAFPGRQLCCTQTDAAVQQQQQRLPEVDGETSLVDVQALTGDQGVLGPFQEGALTSPSSIFTAAGAPPCPRALRPTAVSNSSRGRSLAMLRPPSPLLGAAPVVTVGAELLPGLEEDLQHAAAMFGTSHDREASFQQQQDDVDRCRHPSGSGPPEPAAAAAAGEGYMSDGASAAAAAGVEATCIASLQFEPPLVRAEATVPAAAAGAGGLHPDSPSTGSHAGVHLMPDWELDVIRSSPQDSELQAEIAAAAANSAVAAGRAAVEIPAVLGYKRNPLPRSASSTCEDVRRLALARSYSSSRTPDLQSQLQDCKEHLHASTEIVRQLKQQLEAKDEQIAALNSQTSAQARQLQQQAGELMALRAIIGKQQKQAPGTTAAEVSGGVSKAEAPVTDAGVTATAVATDEQAASPGGASGEQPAPQPVRRSCRLSAATKAAAKDSVSSAFPVVGLEGAAASGTGTEQQSSEDAYTDGATDVTDLRQQLTDARVLITTLEEQLQEVRRQTSILAQQQQTQASQFRGWLQAVEIDAALVRNENQLLKRVLPSAVVTKAAAAARKPAVKAAGGRAAGGKAAAAKAESSQAGTSKCAGGRGISAMKLLLASQKTAEAAANRDAGTVAAPDAQATDSGKQHTAAAAVTTSRAADVFNRQPQLQMPLQATAVTAATTAHPQAVAAALAALREAATAGAGGSTSSNSTAIVQQGSTAGMAIASSSPATMHHGPAYLSLAPGGNGNGVNGPMLVLRPTAGVPLATVLQLNAALSQLAANAGRTMQASAATMLKPAGTGAAGNVSMPLMGSSGQPSVMAQKPATGSRTDTAAAPQVLILNAPACTAVKGHGAMSKAAATASAQPAVTVVVPAATPTAAQKQDVAAATAVASTAVAKQGLNLNDVQGGTPLLSSQHMQGLSP